MVRAVIGVIAGYGVWSVMWIVGNGVFFAEAMATVERGERFEHAGTLAAIIAQSVVCSLAGGAAAGAIAGRRACLAVLVMAALLLATGIAVQAGVWSLAPAWYHLTFLGLIVPGCVAGGLLVRPRARAGAAASAA